jgi:hypothetical protein
VFNGVVVAGALVACTSQVDEVRRFEPGDCQALPAPVPVAHSAPSLDVCPDGGLQIPKPLNPIGSDIRLESAAISLVSQITADQTTYRRLEVDLSAIDGVQPGLGGLPFRSPYHPRRLSLMVDLGVAQEIEAGEYADWNCLNSHYEGTSDSVSTIWSISSFAIAEIDYPAGLAMELIQPEYARLRGVLGFQGQGLLDGSGFCAASDGAKMHYLMTVGWGDCPSGCLGRDYYYFQTDEPGHVAVRDEWLSGEQGEAPCWLALCDPVRPYGDATP